MSFAATWEFGGDVSWIELRLSPEPDGGTRFELDHIVPVKRSLGSGHAVDPAERAAWAASDDGKLFVSLSSWRWCEAYIAAGPTRPWPKLPRIERPSPTRGDAKHLVGFRNTSS